LPTSGGATSAEVNQEASRTGEVHFRSLPLCVFLDPRGPSRSLRNSSSQRAIKNSSNRTQPAIRTPGAGRASYAAVSRAGIAWVFRRGNWLETPAGKGGREAERAARQQGSSFLRENSSNGGKAIRTFWLHSRLGGAGCQE
jgi:hypothetical protein